MYADADADELLLEGSRGCSSRGTRAVDIDVAM